MRNILLVLLCGASTLTLARSLDMSTLSCNNDYKITMDTTLADVRKNCDVVKQSKSHGMYKVKFTNVATHKKVTCTFASNEATARLNSCK